MGRLGRCRPRVEVVVGGRLQKEAEERDQLPRGNLADGQIIYKNKARIDKIYRGPMG